MNVCRGLVGISSQNVCRTVILRLAVVVIVASGARSSAEMAFGSKLMLSYSLDMWDFSESTLGFFVNYGAIVGMLAAATHYGLTVSQNLRFRACLRSRYADTNTVRDRVPKRHSDQGYG